MGVELIQGHCLDLLAAMPDESVNLCVTSPPYWNLRDYKLPPQIWGGSPGCAHQWHNRRYYTGQTAGEEFKDRFHESGTENTTRLRNARWREDASCSVCGAWRGQLGLEPTPELFVEHMVLIFEQVRRVLRSDGCCFINIGDTYHTGASGAGRQGTTSQRQGRRHTQENLKAGLRLDGVKPKDLVGVPWMLAFALRRAGWYLRQEIIWHKPNPMPESVRDRCTKAHEHIFHLSKSEDYWWDFDAMQENVTGGAKPRYAGATKFETALADGDESHRTKAGLRKHAEKVAEAQKRRKLADPGSGTKANSSFDAAVVQLVDMRNKRSVWTVPTHSYSEAHFATFPPDLIRPAIRAACPFGGVVLDPFGGSGTTGQVALEEGRSAILMELGADYIPMAKRRLGKVTPTLLPATAAVVEVIHRPEVQNSFPFPE